MNVNADAVSRNPIVHEVKSRNLHEDDTFMTSQEKMNLEKTFIKINHENNIKQGNNSKSKYFNSLVLPKMIQMTLENPHKIQY